MLDFTFLPKGKELERIDTPLLEHDLNHYEIKLHDWANVWRTKITIEFAIKEDVRFMIIKILRLQYGNIYLS